MCVCMCVFCHFVFSCDVSCLESVNSQEGSQDTHYFRPHWFNHPLIYKASWREVTKHAVGLSDTTVHDL